MQRPTCTNLHIRSAADAHVVFHAVNLGLLPIITRRLDTEERRAIRSGCVFVWEERGPGSDVNGIERWTDSIRWGPSRVRDDFLFYHERDVAQVDRDLTSDSDISPSHTRPQYALARDPLIKQTYSVYVKTSRGPRKWHLIAYFTQNTSEQLRTVEEIPLLACIQVPPEQYTAARRQQTVSTSVRPNALASLSYLRALTPPRRHPMDELALKSFTCPLI